MKVKKLTAGVCAFTLALGGAAPAAFAHDCFVAKKPAKAGSVVEVNVTNGDETVLKNNPGTEEQPHGGFVALTDGGEFSESTFVHAPDGVIPAAREGGPQYNCDGKGLDAFSACGFGE
jgi:hypothetical protein